MGFFTLNFGVRQDSFSNEMAQVDVRMSEPLFIKWGVVKKASCIFGKDFGSACWDRRFGSILVPRALVSFFEHLATIAHIANAAEKRDFVAFEGLSVTGKQPASE